ncbi:hypothetical protein [Candidatus Spongiihabitans sp.]|uniref:hypothetical protein n=1 Tax=Candidatus Spongiihabitans sp. TaxID=3101308 RepID=UPI003C79832A
MDIEKAIEIVQLLSQGIDPETGEEYPGDSPYQQPNIIRALYASVDALEKEKNRVSRNKNLPSHSGSPWSDEEDKKLLEGFKSKKSITELAEAHQRTKGSIHARLVRHGKIEIT